ncbi:MFS transporter [Ostreibacterium oceani]|uniref:hypothetical protein n=1 Tax=Ostreibacterium oceani TaxID=2654998 RepID=UPI001F25086C|nr:hypothetical protein [Ostreibacterium oceani]
MVYGERRGGVSPAILVFWVVCWHSRGSVQSPIDCDSRQYDALVVVAVYFILYASDLMTPLLLLGLVFFISVAWSFENPAFSALIPQLTDASSIGTINHLIDNTKRIAGVVMPLLSIWLASHSDTGDYFLIIAACYLLATVCASRFTPIIPFQPNTASVSLLSRFKTMFRLFLHYPLIMIAVFCFAF